MANNSSINSRNGLNNIRWEWIFILYELIQYLSNVEFIEISSLNRLLRKKLKHLAFYKINLNFDFLTQFSNYFYSEDYEIENEVDDELVVIKNFQSKKIDPFVNDLVNGLNSFDLHFKYISFNRLYRSAYFIFPLISNFSHLTSLSIHDCDINLKDFNKIILKLCKLEYLSLDNIEFVVFAEQSLDAGTLLPKTLKELELGDMNLRKVYYNNIPYEYLFHDKSESLEVEYQISAKRLPNLKKFKLTFDSCFDYFHLAKFLKRNRQLRQITLPCKYLFSGTIRSLRNAKNVEEMTIVLDSDLDSFYRNLNLKPLYSVNYLSIMSITSNQLLKVLNIVKLCPKLTMLHISMDHYYSDLTEQILEKLDQLKDLELEIKDFTFDEFDLSIFSNIESLKLDIGYKKIFGYKLPLESSSLKLIKVFSNYFYEMFNIMLDAYSSSSIWDIKVLDKAIEWRAKY